MAKRHVESATEIMGLRFMLQNTEQNKLPEPKGDHGNIDPAPYRLIHSSGEQRFDNRAEACAAMRQRPGARVFFGRPAH